LSVRLSQVPSLHLFGHCAFSRKPPLRTAAVTAC
jgi:hypothetical protein